MMKLGYFAACTLALAVSFGSMQQVDAGCPCQEKQRPVNKEQQEAYRNMAKQAKVTRKALGGAKAPRSTLNLKKQDRAYGYSSTAKFPIASHLVQDLDPKGTMLTIQDGSGWTISEKDQGITKGWSISDPITITPNKLTFWDKVRGKKSNHKYRIVNLSKKHKNESVEATLSLAPFLHNPHTRRIHRLDKTTGEIVLHNGQVWKVDMKGPCAPIVNEWEKDDLVISGTNDTWFSPSNPYILINVDSDNFVPATRLY